MSKCPSDEINCLRPECLSQCGPVQWLGNLSTCKIRFEYKPPGNKHWDSLGEYEPGAHTTLDGGSLWMPKETAIRAVNAHTGKVVQNWGRVGDGLSSLYIDNAMCSGSFSDEKSATLSHKKVDVYQISTWVLLSVAVLLIISGTIFIIRERYLT